MSRRSNRRKNWLTLALLTLLLVAALVVVVLEFASPATKGRLYGWLPTTSSATAPVMPSK